jgi:4-amino-4-deoxy-L-arabinose transferase-like glycosyltransferase
LSLPKSWLVIVAVAITIMAGALTLNRLGAADVCGTNEAVEGIFVQQMVEHGNLLFPLENGHSPMYKPPLFHWTATAIDRLANINKVMALNLRLPSAIHALAGVILTIYFSWDFIGGEGACLAGLILCGSYQYIEQGRIGRVDMTLCFFETLALFVFMWWHAGTPERERKTQRKEADGERESKQREPSRRYWLRYVFALALGLGVLAKGPVGAILPAAACGIFLLAERRTDRIKALATPGPLLLALVTGGSWYAACLIARRYGFLGRQLGSENFGRFFGALGKMAPWYYLKPIFLNSVPFSLLVPIAVFFALRTFWRDWSNSASRETSARDGDARAREAVRLFAIYWLLSVFFFSMAAYKRRAYLLPLWPVSAVMIAWWVERLAANTRVVGRLMRGAVIVAACAAVIFNAVYLPQREVRECASDSFKDAARTIDRIVGKDEPLYINGFGADPAPLIFYLDRTAPPFKGKLGDAPPGYLMVPVDVWREHQGEALDLTPVFESTAGRPPVVLLRHGKALATEY